MKKIRYISLFVSTAIAAGTIISSCNKSFLEKPALGALSEDVLANKKGVDGLLVGAYGALNGQNVGGGTWESSPDNWIYGSVAGADAHKGSWSGDQPAIDLLGTGKSDPSNGFLNAKYVASYEGIARANSVLRVLEKAADITPEDKKIISGEARFLRGHYYFELKKMFNMIPWIDETTTDLKTPNDQDIWPKIQEDFKYAMDNLNDVSPAIGRVNKWAAAAYLGKAYLFNAKYGEAKAVFEQVIAQGKTSQGVPYDLFDRFEDNFDAATKNGKESVFAVQMSAKDGSGGISNANAGDMLNFPYGDSPFGCCGFYQPTLDLVNSYRTTDAGLPYLDNSYNSTMVTNDMNIKSSQPFTPYAGSLDPRLDWTAGRRGVPYLDWGVHPGQDWIRDQAWSGPYAPKKNIFWQNTADKYWDKSSWAPGSALNVNIIRFADVLLMAAEAEVQSGGSLQVAQKYVNRVRARAAKPASWVYKYKNDSKPLDGFSTTPAANYVISTYPDASSAFSSKEKALTAIYFERKLELAMEGHRFFDLVRWGIAEPVLNAYFTYESKFIDDVKGAKFSSKNIYYPLPQSQVDLSVSGGKPTLKQNPGYN